MQCVACSQAFHEGDLCRALGNVAAYLNHREGPPIVPNAPCSKLARSETDRTDSLDEAQPATRQLPRFGHRRPHRVAAVLCDVALDQSARIEVESQRSSSRSARI